jgi:amino-acid N-acetyltransferase
LTAGLAIGSAGDSDLPEIRRLLARNALPTSDLERSQPSFVVARDDCALVGAGGLEVFESTGLLRSVVVDAAHRRAGLGRVIVAAVERAARRRGVTDLVLLTESARDFFASLGYADIARDEVPEPVRRSAEFQSLCPQSAHCMRKRLG